MKKHPVLVPTALLALLQLLTAGPAFAKTIVIYHTSDAHGWYSPVKTASGPVGGYAALSALAKKDPAPHILLDSGDWFQGTPEGNLTKGMASITLMNALGYAASTVGNHDFDYGQENLKRLIAAAKFPVLGANVYNNATGSRIPYLKPYAMVEVDGVKLGIVGLLTEETAVSVLTKYIPDLIFMDKAAEAAALVPELKSKGAHAVIVLTHSGFPRNFAGNPAPDDGNIAIARKAGGVALILGGHSHNKLPSGYRDPVSGTLFAEGGPSLNSVSRVELEFSDADGKFVKAESRVIPLEISTTGSDEAVEQLIRPITAKISEEMDRVIGFLPFSLTRVHARYQDSTMANWLTDLLREKTGASAAFMNVPGIRADIEQGSVTVRQVYQVMPFDNTVATLEITGSQMTELMRRNISNTGCLMEVSGVEAVYSLDAQGKPADLAITMGGKPIDPQARYKIATTDFMAGGGLGGEIFAEGINRQDTDMIVRKLMLDRIEKGGPQAKPRTGRIKIRPADKAPESK